jgi:hypothetical protein
VTTTEAGYNFLDVYEDGSPNMAYTKLMPLLFSEGLETDPRFQEFLRRMDLL